MNQQSNYLPEDRISLADLIQRFKNFFFYMVGIWKKITIYTLLFATLYSIYKFVQKTNYTAETLFVIEDQRGGSGQLSSLASAVGINIDALGGADGLFSTDNVVELYRSRAMLYKSFLSTENIEGKTERLISRWARDKKLDLKWQKDLKDPSFSFEITPEQWTIKHDSILFVVIEKFKEKNISAKKPDRKLILLSVQIVDTDQLFAKIFNEVLVENVNNFYTSTRTQKNTQNVAILQRQTDSVKQVLDNALGQLALVTENLPNPNPLYFSTQVPLQKLQIDVQSSALVYQELVKNLELSKISLRNEKPLIQIVDRPMLPLEDDKDRPLKTIVLSLIFGGMISSVFLGLQYILRVALEEEGKQN